MNYKFLNFKLLFFLMLFLGIFVMAKGSLADCTGASPSWNSTPDYASVSSCYTSAKTGDTINISAGSATWTSTLNVNKAITLRGDGSGATVITNNIGIGYDNPCIKITPASDDDMTEITGIGFSLHAYGSDYVGIVVNGRGRGPIFIPTKIRIDNNFFTGGSPGIFTFGTVYGVIDHNNFNNVSTGILGSGENDQIWIDAYNAGGIFAGTSKAMFVENNTFIINSGAGSRINYDASVYLQLGAPYVVRYNTVDLSGADLNYADALYNHHGNQSYASDSFRGQPIFESYNNTVTCPASGSCKAGGFRGGSVIIHDDTIINGDNPYNISEEECWQTAFFSPLRTNWPAQDQIMNSFFWNIKYNGTYISDIDVTRDGDCNGIFVQKNRDYFMHAPAASGGKESFTGTRFGGSTTSPTQNDTGSMIFTASGNNAYYPYTPYTYPHPLVSGSNPPNDATAPAVPSGLTVQ